MNILFVVNALGNGGAEKIFMDLIKNFDTAKHKITVLMVDHYGVYVNQIPDDITKKYIFQHVSTPFLKKKWCGVISVIGRYFLRKKNAKYFYTKYLDAEYDVEIAFLEGEATRLVAQSSNPYSVKYAWLHTDMIKNPWSSKCYPNQEAEQETYRVYDRIIAVSSSVKESFEKKFGLETQVIYNALDEKEVLKRAEEFVCERQEKNKLRFITVGRLEKVKGFERLIKVFAKVLEEYKNIELILIGSGSERDKLERLISENKVSNSIFLYGYKENPYPYVKSSDIFISSSYAEGFSTVVTEALILGLPVVTTDCAGMRELLGDSEYGLIVENSEAGLFTGITEMTVNAELRQIYGKKALERGKNFCVKDRIREIEDMMKCDCEKKIREHKKK